MSKRIKAIIGTAVLVLAALSTLALAVPTPTANACLFCVPPECPPCTALGGGSCFRCPSCKPIPGCHA